MMILPLADALQNCLQNLTSRIAGVDNEQMTSRVMGMGAMLGFGLGAIKEQFNSPAEKIKNSNGNDNNSSGGLKGFVSRAKSVINPSMNLSDEKDYNGNINPIREVLPKEKTTNNTTYNKNTNENVSNNKTNKTTMKSVVGKVAKASVNATKTYLATGAKMAEGNFNKSSYTPYKTKPNNRKSKLNNTEYINKVATNNEIKKLGDTDESKE